jgi:hypothetical protein
MTKGDKIKKLDEFKLKLKSWDENRDKESREFINQNSVWVKREVLEAGCYETFTIGPPPAIGGLIMRDVDPFGVIFDPPYMMNMIPHVTDMIDKTIGVLLSKSDAPESVDEPIIQIEENVERGYVFIAMPIILDDRENEDVLDAIKESAKRCGLNAERVDEAQSNQRITDRILESIQKAEYVIVDLTNSRPNVFYEAGYAQGTKKTPIYIARKDTKLEFDLKDYPVIFFAGMKDLKDKLEKRLRALAKEKTKTSF